MKVTLIDYNQNAVDKLIFCKSTRLQMSANKFEDIKNMSALEKEKELEYISNTIKSSWEFLDYTFMIEGVTRAFTHQFVRNRQGSYAQQTMRILNVSGFDYVTGPSIESDPMCNAIYKDVMSTIQAGYDELIKLGANIEDARGLLPTNICTNIVVKYNLRTLSELLASRSSPRTQGEFREVIELMYNELISVHPWLDMFLHNEKYHAAKKLDGWIRSDYEGTDNYLHLLKLVDILRK
jgi:flavin-dependent thymidylate synthase